MVRAFICPPTAGTTCMGEGLSPLLRGLTDTAQLHIKPFERKKPILSPELTAEATRSLRISSYKILFAGTGRTRLRLEQTAFAAVPHVINVLSVIRGITKVTWNELSGSLLILYSPNSLSSLQVQALADEVLGACGIHPSGSRRRELKWSLASGAAIVLSFVLRQTASHLTLLTQGLEMIGFGMTAYSVITHRGRLLGGPKSLHLDSILAMLSVFNLGSTKALAGLFLTWLVNFLEILGWQPIANRT